MPQSEVYVPPPLWVPVEHDPYSDAAELFMSDDEGESEPAGEDNNMPIGLIAQIAIECIKFGKHVSEIFSPPRVTKVANKIGLKPGFALDLTENDPVDGLPWDFSKQEKRERALNTLREEKPYLLVGSPPCTVFSSLFSANISRMDPAVVKSRIREGVRHIMFCVLL